MRTAGPVVIIGAARSGTKFLRDVLAADSGTRAVPYDVNYVWRYGVAHDADDDLDPTGLTPARRTFIRATLSRLAGIGARRSDLRLIEKTVSNTLRVPFVREVLPDAHFVHLIRDGRDVTESAMRLWQAPPDWRALVTKLRGLPLANLGYAAWFGMNALRGLAAGRTGGRVWGPRYPGIAADVARLPLSVVCARQWCRSVAAAREGLAPLPEDQVTEIRYEELVADSAGIERIVARAGLTNEDAVLAAWRARVRHDIGERWRALPAGTRCQMLDELAPLLGELGYA